MKLSNYQGTCVVQRDPDLGCIPSGIEWMMRYRQIEVPDDFQERFNLQRQGMGDNNFKTIAKAVKKEFPGLTFKFMQFPQGAGKEKLNQVETAIKEDTPCLLSIHPVAFNGDAYHVVPVMEIDDSEVRVMWMDDPQLRILNRRTLEVVHDACQGGDDILMLSV